MDYFDREILVNRIVSGIHIYNIDGVEYIIRPSSRIEKYRADLVYSQTLAGAIRKDIPTEEYLDKFSKIKGLWSDAEEEELKRLTDEMDSLKISLYENFNKEEAKLIRSRLSCNRDGIDSLLSKKSTYTTYSDKWLAMCARQRYLISQIAGTNDEYIVGAIISRISNDIISDTKMRELARNDPWRSIWMTRDDGLFGVPACDLTNDQQRLCIYSIMYDRIHDHPDRPSDEVIDDDDAIDGWKILQHRKSTQEREEKMVLDKINNPKIANSHEVFIPVKSDDELKAVNNLNDVGAKVIKRQREAKVEKEGSVSHQDFLDQRLLIQESLRNRS